ncbi:hypothetical protein LC612_38830 [Nostoc sp. CHAB 5834]|nr:hypothetical protein [Nostoc sp. CHAB 5834]
MNTSAIKAARLLLLVPLVAVAACSATFEPKIAPLPAEGFDLVDPFKVDQIQYVVDFRDCSALANQEQLDLTHAAANAVNTVVDRATLGILGGKSSKHADRITVLKRCLAGRGYNLLR